MARTTRRLSVSPEVVLETLADGWRYAGWVVGARRIREVDDTWPAPGSRFHHSFGVGLLKTNDATEIERFERDGDGVEVALRARAWPAGEARVTITVEPDGEGGTVVTMDEAPSSGPAKTIHNPLLDKLTALRNAESLRRLDRLTGRPPARQGEGATSWWG